MVRRMSIWVASLAAGGVAVGAVAVVAGATIGDGEPPAPSTSVSENGVTIDLSLDQASAELDDVVIVRTQIVNQNDHPVTIDAPCPSLPVAVPGSAPTGSPVKDRFVAAALAAGAASLPSADNYDPSIPVACPAVETTRQLDPGEVVAGRSRLAVTPDLIGLGEDGAPTIEVTAALQIYGGDERRPTGRAGPTSVSLAVELDDEHDRAVTPVEALVTLMDDQRAASWIERWNSDPFAPAGIRWYGDYYEVRAWYLGDHRMTARIAGDGDVLFVNATSP